MQTRRGAARAAAACEDDNGVVRMPNPVPLAAAGLLLPLAVALVASTAVFSVEAASVEPPEASLSDTLGALIDPTVAALVAGEGAADGRSGRYVVTWSDAFSIGSQGYGLVNELERRGFDDGVPIPWLVPVTEQRVIEPSEATANVLFATGNRIAALRDDPDAVEVAYVETRDTEELAEYARGRDQVITELENAGLGEPVSGVDDNLFGISIDDRLPESTRLAVTEMLELGVPTAVLILPPETAG